MIVQTPPAPTDSDRPHASEPSVAPIRSVDRIEFELQFGEFSILRTYHPPQEGMSWVDCLNALIKFEEVLLDPFSCSRDTTRRLGNNKRDRAGSLENTLIDGWDSMQIVDAEVVYEDGGREPVAFDAIFSSCC